MPGTVIACLGPRRVGAIPEPDRPAAAGEVKIRTSFSGISAGTEMATYRGWNPHLNKRWEAERRLFVSASQPVLAYPVTDWGYEEAGEVIEVGPGVEGLPPGTLVYGTWGHRSQHIAAADWARQRILPAGLDPLVGTFSHIGAVALNGALDAAVRIGETAAVFGLGVVGLLVAQLLQQSGAEVIGVDLIPRRLEIARRLGIARVIDGRQGSAAEEIKLLTANRGADVSVEASGSPTALHEAIRACAYSSRVVAMGFFEGEARGLYLGDESHHNRINIVVSQISGVAPELQHRWDRMRLVHTFMRLAAEGRVQVQPLITHIVPTAEACSIYELLDRSPAEVLQAVLDFRGLEAA